MSNLAKVLTVKEGEIVPRIDPSFRSFGDVPKRVIPRDWYEPLCDALGYPPSEEEQRLHFGVEQDDV